MHMQELARPPHARPLGITTPTVRQAAPGVHVDGNLGRVRVEGRGGSKVVRGSRFTPFPLRVCGVLALRPLEFSRKVYACVLHQPSTFGRDEKAPPFVAIVHVHDRCVMGECG
jgi:hypothetical protein